MSPECGLHERLVQTGVKGVGVVGHLPMIECACRILDGIIKGLGSGGTRRIYEGYSQRRFVAHRLLILFAPWRENAKRRNVMFISRVPEKRGERVISP